LTERRVKIHYRRPPDREEVFDQLLVLERDDVTVTLVETMDFDLPMRISNEVALEQGSSVVWFTFPNAWHDIGRFHTEPTAPSPASTPTSSRPWT
jgi:hypothetical protein